MDNNQTLIVACQKKAWPPDPPHVYVYVRLLGTQSRNVHAHIYRISSVRACSTNGFGSQRFRDLVLGSHEYPAGGRGLDTTVK